MTTEPTAGDDRPEPQTAELELVIDPLDGARSRTPVIASELREQRRAASDSSLALEERLEAFEDIMDSEVGDTSLSRARNVEREVGLRQIYLKFEGGNPTGTQKDRIAFAQAMDALRRGFDAITLATCGNYGAAMALAASVGGLRCEVFVPERFQTKRFKEIESFGATIHRTPGDYEATVEHSKRYAEEHEVYDANPGGNNLSQQLIAYGEIANEIYDELRDAPAAVAVSVSNGTTIAGIYKGFVRLHRRGKISRLPKMIAGSSFNKNPIVSGFLTNAERCDDLRPEKVRETAVNEPLINWHSIDGDAALEAIRASDGWAGHASDRTMLSLSRLLREQQGLNVLPAATAGLHALISQHKKQPLTGDRYVVVLTGRKL